MQDFRVETFLTVCRTMNYTRAAKALNITQPAVSQHIAHLEKAYGARLFDYRGKRLTLTEAGELVRSTLSIMDHDERLLRERVAAAVSGARIDMSVGTVSYTHLRCRCNRAVQPCALRYGKTPNRPARRPSPRAADRATHAPR